ncbi:rna exonuclease [Trichoderma arundinaceum]|uniref:Rna exonuclease n=1 Tax=Trichoderma arundinaceum TaxID=490622 RepID=A0A395NEW0_TRIAR|nr:rna exonuclease [Trichoderma arundinaceum]
MPPAAGQAPVRPAANPVSFSGPSDNMRAKPIQQSEEYSQQLQALVHSHSELQKSGYVMHQLSGPDLDRKRRCFQCGRRKQDHTPKIYASGELETEWLFYHTPPFGFGSQAAVAVVIDCEMGTASTGESELIRVSAVDYFSGAVLLDSLVYPDVKMLHYNTRYSGVTRQGMENARRMRSCIFGRASARRALWSFVGPNTIVIGHSVNSDLTSLRWIHPVVVDTLIIEKRNRPPEENKKDKEDKDDMAQGEDKQATQSPQGAASDPQLKRSDGNSREEAVEKRPAKPRQRGGLSLKALAKERLARDIQVSGRGHDSVEDSIATRDILHWNVLKLLEDQVQQAEAA